MFGFGKRDEKKEDELYNTSFSAASGKKDDFSSVGSPSSMSGGYQQRSAIPAHMDDN